MYTSNRERRKKLILAYPDTRRIYRTIQVLFLFLIVSTLVTFCISKWSEYKLSEQKNLLFGEWDHVYVNVDEKNLSYFEKHAFIEKYGIQKIQDRTYIDNKRIVIGSCDEDFFELGNLKMISGRLPLNDGEVAIEKEYLSTLGVEQVGDYIPDEIGIPSLVGYQVCGVIQDYSSRWNMVNPDLKLINCFIVSSDVKITQIFSKSLIVSQNDININMLTSYINISTMSRKNLSNVLIFYVIILGICFVLFLRLIAIHTRRFLLFNSNSLMRAENNNYRLLLMFFCRLLLILFFILLFNYFFYKDKDMMLTNSWIDSRIINLSIEDIFYISKDNKYAAFLFFPNNQIESLLEITILLFWLFFINYIVVEMFINFLRIEYTNNNKYKLRKYYYDTFKPHNKKFKSKLYFSLFAEYLCMILIFLCFERKNISIANAPYIASYLILFNTTVLLINAYFIKKTIKRLESNTDWLLKNESE